MPSTPQVELSESARLAFALTGDPSARHWAYGRYRGLLVIMARDFGPDLVSMNLREDILQETWLLFYQRANWTRMTGVSPEAYLRGLVRDAVKSLRAQYRPSGARSRPEYKSIQSEAKYYGNLTVELDVDAIPDLDRAEQEEKALDGRLDLTLRLARAESQVQDAASRMRRGENLCAAAVAVGMTRQTLTRKLRSLASAA